MKFTVKSLSIIILSASFLVACKTKSVVSTTTTNTKTETSVSNKTTPKESITVKTQTRKTTSTEKKKEVSDPKLTAEKNATPEGKAILETGRKMALEEKIIIKGGCWNWVNECFRRAGYGTDRHIAYKSKKSGPERAS